MRTTADTIQAGKDLPNLHSIGISVWDTVYARQEHMSSHWEIVHIVSGEVVLHLAKDLYRGKRGDTLLIPAGTPHRDEFPLDRDFEVLHIMFEWDTASATFPRRVNADLVNLPQVDKQAVREMAFETYDCLKKQRLMWREMTRACLYRLLLFLRTAAMIKQG